MPSTGRPGRLGELLTLAASVAAIVALVHSALDRGGPSAIGVALAAFAVGVAGTALIAMRVQRRDGPMEMVNLWRVAVAGIVVGTALTAWFASSRATSRDASVGNIPPSPAAMMPTPAAPSPTATMPSLPTQSALVTSAASATPRPDAAFLADMDPVSGMNVEAGTASLSGVAYIHATTAFANVGTNEASPTYYNIERKYRRFVATVGIGDDSRRTDIRVRFEVLADGRQIYTNDLGFGQTAPVDLDVSGVLRLTISVAPLRNDDNATVPCVWGDAQLTT